MIAYELAKERPDLAARIIGAVVDRAVACGTVSGYGLTPPFPKRGHDVVHLLQIITERTPIAVVQELLPRITELVQKFEVADAHGVLHDQTWRWKACSTPLDFDDAVLEYTARAMEALATTVPETLDKLTGKAESMPHETLGYLLLRAWSADGRRFADRAGEYLAEDPQRLGIGYSMGSGGDLESAVARAALAAITPHCSPSVMAKLEDAIRSYSPIYESSEPQRRGMIELSLWKAVDRGRLSPSALARLDELERKFPTREFALPEQGRDPVGYVRSPIPRERASNMGNDHWISAMRKYSSDRPTAFDDFLKGGKHELSQVLEEVTSHDPERFSRLAEEMPDDLAPDYFDAIARGLCKRIPPDTDATSDGKPVRCAGSLEQIVRVIRRMDRLPSKPCGRWLCDAIREIAQDRVMPDDVVDMAAWYAINDPDPVQDSFSRPAGDGGDEQWHSGLIFGINTTRGSAADAIAALLNEDKTRWKSLETAVEALANDPCLSVRTVAANVVGAALNVDRQRAIDLFLKLCQDAEAILGSPTIARFFPYVVRRDYPQVRPVLQRMLSSADTQVVRSGARCTVLAGMMSGDAVSDADDVIRGSEAMREAAAEIYAYNLTNDECRDRCIAGLLALFSDPSPQVQSAAATCFSRFKSEPLTPYTALIETFAKSNAFLANPEYLIRLLEEHVFQLPDVVCAVAERFVREIGPEATSIAYRAGHHSYEISKIVVRLYEQTQNDDTQRRCLDVMDRMLQLGLIGIEDAISSSECPGSAGTGILTVGG